MNSSRRSRASAIRIRRRISVTYTFNPTPAVSFLDKGLNSYLGVSVWLKAHYQNPFRFRLTEAAAVVQRFSDINYGSCLAVLNSAFDYSPDVFYFYRLASASIAIRSEIYVLDMFHFLEKTIFFCFLLGTLVVALNAQGPLKIVQTETPPKIDGVLSPDEWKSAAEAALDFQVYPNQDDTPASEKSKTYITHDRENLYVAFYAFDSDPSGIRAPISKRDNTSADDSVTVFFDTYDDKQRAYYFSVSAAGVQQDGIFTDSGGTDDKWDGIFEAKAQKMPDGYVVEMRIPFKSLRFRAGKDDRWGVHFRRWIARKSERSSWMRLSLNKPSLLAQAGTMSGFTNVFSGSTIDVIPTVTASNTATREIDLANPSGGRLNGVNKIDPGVTVIYSITPNMTLSATVNPDFSQIEADVPQVSVNQRFPLFYPERRPFFLEGNEVFRSSYSAAPLLIDTRQIVDPDWGVKLTGKTGKNTIGILAASDNSAGLRLNPNDTNFGKNAQFTIARYSRDLFEQSSLGFIVTDRRFAGSSNTVGALDGRFRFGSGKQLFAFQTAYSRTKELDGTKRSGGLSYFAYTYNDRKWSIGTTHSGAARNFRAQSGFIRRTGYLRSYGYAYRAFRPKEKSWWVRVSPFAVALAFRDQNGKLDESFFDPGVDLEFARGITVYTYFSTRRDNFLGRGRTTRAYVNSFAVNSFRRFAISGEIEMGTGVNFDPLRDEIGRLFNSTLTVTLRPFNKLNSEFLWLKSSLKSRINGEGLFHQDIYRNRTIYQFNQDNAIRSIIDYDTLERRIGLSFLYAYTPRPNTAVYVGYGDALYNGLDPLTFQRRAGLVRQSRSLFAKFSYNFRF